MSSSDITISWVNNVTVFRYTWCFTDRLKYADKFSWSTDFQACFEYIHDTLFPELEVSMEAASKDLRTFSKNNSHQRSKEPR